MAEKMYHFWNQIEIDKPKTASMAVKFTSSIGKDHIEQYQQKDRH